MQAFPHEALDSGDELYFFLESTFQILFHGNAPHVSQHLISNASFGSGIAWQKTSPAATDFNFRRHSLKIWEFRTNDLFRCTSQRHGTAHFRQKKDNFETAFTVAIKNANGPPVDYSRRVKDVHWWTTLSKSAFWVDIFSSDRRPCSSNPCIS